MTVILFFVSVYNAFVGILWGKEARDRAIAIHVNAMSEKGEGKNGEKLARPFLHPRITGLESGEYESAPRATNGVYDSAFPATAPNGATSGGNYHHHPSHDADGRMMESAPPVSSLYLPTPSSPSQQDQAFRAPFAADSRESGSISDRTVVADPLSEGPSNTSSSDLGKQKRGLRSFFSKS